MDLDNLLSRPEGKTLEFKRDLSSPAGVLRTVVAFANTAGGVLLIGVEDVTRDVCGVDDPLATSERLANLISDVIAPRLVPDIEILPWRSTNLVAVEVYPSQSRPHFIAKDGPKRGAYVRVGSTNRRTDPELLDEMRRASRGEAFDEQPMPELDADQVDFTAASQSFASVRVLEPADLTTLRLVATHQGRLVPTVGGVLLFGVNREHSFPDAWIQVGRFDGTDKTRILDSDEIHSLPAQAIEATIAFVRKHLTRSAVIGETRRTDRWSLPQVALREAVVNAVAHADYAQRGGPIRVSIFDDRVEIENPGLLPLGLTVEDLRSGVSKLRNRVIGRVLRELGLMEQWGSGVRRIISECQAAGLPEPMFEELGGRFRVTLPTDAAHLPRVDATDQAILDTLARAGAASTAEIAEAVGLGTRAIRARLARLIDRDLVQRIGSSANDPNRRYVLTRGER